MENEIEEYNKLDTKISQDFNKEITKCQNQKVLSKLDDLTSDINNQTHAILNHGYCLEDIKKLNETVWELQRMLGTNIKFLEFLKSVEN